MAVDIHNLIAAINPDLYCEASMRSKVKAIIKEKGYLAAAEIAKSKEFIFMDIDKLVEKDEKELFKAVGLKSPMEKHAVTYDASAGGMELLEQIYFKILDDTSKQFKTVDKVIDSFVASPGSSYFSEMGMKATRLQEEAMKILGTANQLVRSVLNLIYDLKEFELRLKTYNQLSTGSDVEKEAAKLSLKQIWLDTVDIKKGNTSIKAMALGQADFVTLLDAFMKANTLEEADKLDLNERVKRILKQRINEFLDWIKASEKELRKRYEIERNYLRSQVNSLSLYARWAKPYLRAAKALEQRASPTAALVTAFNTVLFELSLLGADEYKVEDRAKEGVLPMFFIKQIKRKYNSVIVIEIKFRSTPQQVGQHQRFRGKMEAVFTSYALNEDEIKVLKEELMKDDFEDIMGAIQGSTLDLETMREDIDHFLAETKEEKKEEKKPEEVNPFAALFSFLKLRKKEEKAEEKKEAPLPIPLKPDSSSEKVVRSKAAIDGRKKCKKVFDVFKKSYNMPTI